MLEEIRPGVLAEKASENAVAMSAATLTARAYERSLPRRLTLEQLGSLLGKKYQQILGFETEKHEYLIGITSRERLGIAFDDSLTMVIERDEFKWYLIEVKRWPIPEECLLSKWWPDNESKPWLNVDIRDKPLASETWQTAARYFYRQHKKANPELLKKNIVSLVLDKLQEHELYKRGGKVLPTEAAIAKILQNIEL